MHGPLGEITVGACLKKFLELHIEAGIAGVCESLAVLPDGHINWSRAGRSLDTRLTNNAMDRLTKLSRSTVRPGLMARSRTTSGGIDLSTIELKRNGQRLFYSNGIVPESCQSLFGELERIATSLRESDTPPSYVV